VLSFETFPSQRRSPMRRFLSPIAAAADLDPAAPPATSGRTMKFVPGSFKLLFLDPS
jgi:hypothetical protein